MYAIVLVLHSLFRWLVIISLSLAIFRSYKGYSTHKKFSSTDNKIRHWTATIAHIQLILGVLVYIKSPIMNYYFSDFQNLFTNWELSFFGLIHSIGMCIAIVVITIGSAKAKRKQKDREKFKTMLVYFSIGLLIILLVIPWPFSPFANRSLIRTF